MGPQRTDQTQRVDTPSEGDWPCAVRWVHTWTGFPPRRDDFLGHGPIGNLPLFLWVLKTGAPERRRIVLLREVAFAHLVLVTLLLIGDYV